MSPNNRALLEAIREQAYAHAVQSEDVIQVANNRTQEIALTASAMSAASILAAIDIALAVE